jgi:hypothetical protein
MSKRHRENILIKALVFENWTNSVVPEGIEEVCSLDVSK